MPPRTIAVPPAGPAATLTYTLPPGLTLDVESVYALIDAGAAGATRATLTIADSSGAVIARKRQSETIDAGENNGSATWALRLADESAGGAATATKYEAFVPLGSTLANFNAITTMPFVHGFGDVLGSFAAGVYTIAAAGTYAVAVNVQALTGGPAYFVIAELTVALGTTPQVFSSSAARGTAINLPDTGPALAITRTFAAGDKLRVRITHNSGAAITAKLFGGLAKLA